MNKTSCHRIVYTLTDEAPALATYSWLPIVRCFLRAASVEVKTKDISLAARILANFSDFLPEDQRVPDALGELKELVHKPAANIIKLPNISASLPQLQAAIRELQDQGYPIPDFPRQTYSNGASPPQQEADISARYGKVLGSAVNPVLREGNSDRRVAKAVKQYAQKYPHTMGRWEEDSKSHVASMKGGDFYSSERAIVMEKGGEVRVELCGDDGQTTVLKEKVLLLPGEIVDSSMMSCRELRDYYWREMDLAKEEGVLISLHLKATMMKVSDPIIFGHGVEIFYREVFEKYRPQLSLLGVEARNGMGDVYGKIGNLSPAERDQIKKAITQAEDHRAPLAMVDSDRGISNLCTPNNVIIDASMPAAIRNSGKMWGPDGKIHDIKALIPDRCYGGIYQEVMDYCRRYGAFDVSTMGNVCNVGLMAKKAQEYGSHDKTFEISTSGVVRVVDGEGSVLLQHKVEEGDIWRMCQTKDEAVRDWVRLAVERTRDSGVPAVFWLDPQRSHDVQLIRLVHRYLQDHDTEGLEVSIMSPIEAIRHCLQRMSEGLDTISVTGNVLRDYLTDLFPILELGTSAKMLSIVPLLSGGSLYETGAGGSAPKHVEQFIEENHLRWDSLGEFLALAASMGDLARETGRFEIGDLARALDQANGEFLQSNKSPSRKVGELDSRGSHFYLALYWAQYLKESTRALQLAEVFSKIYGKLKENESAIVEELLSIQGKSVDMGGYYHPDPQKLAKAMRPCELFNKIIANL